MHCHPPPYTARHHVSTSDLFGSEKLGISRRTMLWLVVGKSIVLPAAQYALATAGIV
jgi:hypothetical protein